MEFSEKLKTIRTQANFTQNELAEKLAISRQAISNYEQGRSYPSIDILIEMSKLFNVSLDELLESGRKKMQMKRLLALSIILFASIVANYISIYVLVRGNNFSSLNLVFGIALYFIPFMYLAMYFLFQYNPPKTINKIYGYRTKRSMQNQLTWNYSQNCFSDKSMSDYIGFKSYDNATKSGYIPCKLCKPTSKRDVKLSIPFTSKEREYDSTDDLEKLCEKFGYKYNNNEDLFAIITPVGEWLIYTKLRPIRLQHCHLGGDIHNQPRAFLSLKDAFEYIHRHDSYIIKKQ